MALSISWSGNGLILFFWCQNEYAVSLCFKPDSQLALLTMTALLEVFICIEVLAKLLVVGMSFPYIHFCIRSF